MKNIALGLVVSVMLVKNCNQKQHIYHDRSETKKIYRHNIQLLLQINKDNLSNYRFTSGTET